VNEDGEPVVQLGLDELDAARLPPAGGRWGTPNLPRCRCQCGMSLADLDHDGLLDLVMRPVTGDPDFDLLVAFGIRESPTRFSAAERIRRLPRESPTLPSSGRLCAVGDVDVDGHMDLIVGDPDFDLLRVLHSESPSAGTNPLYEERLRVTPTAQTTGRVIVDMDRDGHRDLLVTTVAGLFICWQDPAAPGTFSPPVALLQSPMLVGVFAQDVNNDGCPDCVFGLANGCGALLRDPSRARGFLAPLPSPCLTAGDTRALALGDVDGDGLLDVLAIRESPTRASLMRGRGDGFFDVFTELDLGLSNPGGCALADLDGDGRLDVAACGEDGAVVVRQDPFGPTPWRAPQPLVRMGGGHVAAGDLDCDGRCDLVVCGDGGVRVALQSPLDDPGDFQESYALSPDACGGLALCDLDRDGALDVVFVEGKTGAIVGVRGDPDFDLLRVLSLNGLPPGEPIRRYGIAVGDLDGDGYPDILATGPTAPGVATNDLVIVRSGP
jgi:hypothetical protein